MSKIQGGEPNDSPRRLHAYREDLFMMGRLYMTRWVLRVLGLGELRLHYTAMPDIGRQDLHDHPWWMLSFMLWGWYTHMVNRSPWQTWRNVAKVKRRRWLSLEFLPRSAAHSIVDVSPGGAWTLVITGRRHEPEYGAGSGSWGFWTRDRGWVPYRSYFSVRTHAGDSSSRCYWYFGGPPNDKSGVEMPHTVQASAAADPEPAQPLIDNGYAEAPTEIGMTFEEERLLARHLDEMDN